MKRILLALSLLWPGATFAAELVQHLPEEFCLAARAAATPDQQMLEWTHCLEQEQLTPKQRALAYNARAILYAKREDYQNALADLNSAIAADPARAALYVNRGAVYRRLNNPDKAVADLTQGIKLDPSIAEAYLERGTAFIALTRFDEAIADFTTVISIDPHLTFTALTLRAFAHAAKQDWQGTVADCTLAMKINDAIELYSIRAAAYANSRQYDKALADFSTVIARQPSNALAYNNRATIYANMKKYDLAIADLGKAIAISPSEALFYSNRGSEYDEIGDCKSAIADFDTALSLGPDGLAYSGKAWVRATCPDATYRNGAEAVDLAVKALGSGSSVQNIDNAATFHMSLAAAHAENGEFDAAVVEQKLAIKLLPGDAHEDLKKRADLALQAFMAKKPFRWPPDKLMTSLGNALPASSFAASGHSPVRTPLYGPSPILMTKVAMPTPPPLPLHLILP